MKTLSILIAALLFSFAGMTVHELSSKTSAPTELAKKKKNNKNNKNNRNRTKTTKIESKGLTKANELGSGNAKKMEQLVNQGTANFGYRPQSGGAAAAAAALEKMKKSGGLKK